MRAYYENDAARGPGFGLFRVEEAGLPQNGQGLQASYALLRAGDHKSLHSHGWEDSEYRLTPDGIREEGGALLLLVGPEVVRHLDELNTYRFFLHLGDETRRAPLELAGIVYPPESGRGGVAGAQPPPAIVTKPEPMPETPPALPQDAEDVRDESDTAPLALVAAPVSPRPSRLPLLLGLLAALLLAAAALWFFVLRQQEQPAPPTPETEKTATEQDLEKKPEAGSSETEKPKQEAGAQEQAPKEEVKADASTAQQAQPAPEPVSNPASTVATPEPQPSTQSPTQPSVQTPPQPPLIQARTFMRGGGTAADALALARVIEKNEAETPSPESRDAVFLLLGVAAEGGDPAAMLGLGGFYDPADKAPKGSILPDPEQAKLWYDKAEQAGQADAAPRKANLRAYLEKEAAQGSAEAKAMLDAWN